MFSAADSDLLGLPTNSNHINVEWDGPGKVLFSMTRRGDGLSCHMAADKKSLRMIKRAINEFCDWAFNKYDWCRVIMAVTEYPSIGRILTKCGFVFLDRNDKAAAYGRFRKCHS